MQGKKLKEKDNSQNKIFITSIYFKLFIKNLQSQREAQRQHPSVKISQEEE